MSKNVFFTKFSELSGNRFDTAYYIPELVELEKKVTNISKKRLKDFVLSVSSGATPKTTEQSEYYTEDKESGIPFLRVQNLTTQGNLNTNNAKYINEKTHEGMLKRSQVEENDLLIKITGVGRMAIASVPEIGFKGNTNQHMVVVKTKDRLTSQTLATYLNLDIAEKLASRRATGGTRPALDYPALLSIPIIYDENIVVKLEEAYNLKDKKEKEAQKKIDSIDEYLLNELGIEIASSKKESLEDRVFFRKFSAFSGNRFDPFYIKNNVYISNSNKYDLILIKEIAKIQKGQSITKDTIVSGIYPVIAGGQTSPYSINSYNENGNVITVSASGAYAGYVWYHKSKIFASDCSVVKSFDENIITTLFLFEMLKAKQNYIYSLQQGAGQPHIYARDIEQIKIPLPSIKIQNKIVSHIQQLRDESKALKDEAMQIYEDTKKEIENMILGDI